MSSDFQVDVNLQENEVFLFFNGSTKQEKLQERGQATSGEAKVNI